MLDMGAMGKHTYAHEQTAKTCDAAQTAFMERRRQTSGAPLLNEGNEGNMSTETMLEEYTEEFMRLAADGNTEAHDFSVGESDAVCVASRRVIAGLMKAATNPNDAAVALWARCARHAFLDVLAKEAAPEWARQEYTRRRCGRLDLERNWRASEWPQLWET